MNAECTHHLPGPETDAIEAASKDECCFHQCLYTACNVLQTPPAACDCGGASSEHCSHMLAIAHHSPSGHHHKGHHHHHHKGHHDHHSHYIDAHNRYRETPIKWSEELTKTAEDRLEKYARHNKSCSAIQGRELETGSEGANTLFVPNARDCKDDACTWSTTVQSWVAEPFPNTWSDISAQASAHLIQTLDPMATHVGCAEKRFHGCHAFLCLYDHHASIQEANIIRIKDNQHPECPHCCRQPMHCINAA